MMPRKRSAKSWPMKLGLGAVGLVVAGCWGHPVERTLHGRWLGESVDQVDDAALAAATGWVKGASLEFSGGKVTVSIPAEEPRTAKYRVERVNKNDVTLAVLRPSGAVDKLQLSLEESERALRWKLGGGRSIVMRRED